MQRKERAGRKIGEARARAGKERDEEEEEDVLGQVQRQPLEANFSCTGLKSFRPVASGQEIWEFFDTRAFYWQIGQ